jgi:hypothetical protein
MKLLVGTGTLVSTAELGEVIGADNETVKNWIRRGIVSRAPIGGRQLRNRLFSAEEVYKAALKNGLVKVGIPPSPASDAVNALWKQWNKKLPPEGRNLYALLSPSKDNWIVVLCAQRTSGGPLYEFGRSTGNISGHQTTLPKQASALLPISDIFERVSSKMLALLRG